MMKLNIKQEHYDMLSKIFIEYCPNAEIWAYGSRLTSDYHSGSDLDLVVKSFNDNTKKLYELKELITDSNVPFLVDISEYDRLPETFKNQINEKYVVFYKK